MLILLDNPLGSTWKKIWKDHGFRFGKWPKNGEEHHIHVSVQKGKSNFPESDDGPGNF